MLLWGLQEVPFSWPADHNFFCENGSKRRKLWPNMLSQTKRLFHVQIWNVRAITRKGAQMMIARETYCHEDQPNGSSICQPAKVVSRDYYGFKELPWRELWLQRIAMKNSQLTIMRRDTWLTHSFWVFLDFKDSDISRIMFAFKSIKGDAVSVVGYNKLLVGSGHHNLYFIVVMPVERHLCLTHSFGAFLNSRNMISISITNTDWKEISTA